MKDERFTYYDIHTHQPTVQTEVITVISLDLRDHDMWPELFSARESISEYYSVGIHPWFPEKNLMTKVREYAISPLVVAIGETGLDKITANSAESFKLQQDLFIEHIILSEKVKKPLIIHCVRAWNDLLHIHKTTKPSMPWIIHGFRGNATLAGQLIDAGLYLSFSGLYNTDSLKAAWMKRRLLIETDDTKTDIRDVYTQIANNLEITPKELFDEIERFFISKLVLSLLQRK